MICIKNGQIHDAVTEEAFLGDILIEDGKIKEIGAGLAASAGLWAAGENGGDPCNGRTQDIQVIDATGL